MAATAVLLGKAKIQQDRFGVTKVQIAIRFGWEAGANLGWIEGSAGVLAG